MKKIKLFMFLAALGLMFVSCTRDITEPVISSNPTKPSQTAVSFNSTVFDKYHMDDLITFSWQPVDFGFKASVTYTVQASNKQDFSSNVVTVLTSTSLSGTASFKDMNGNLISWNYPTGTAVTVYFKVMASVSSSVPAVYSDVFTKSFTVFDMSYPFIFVRGDHNGWSADAYNRLYSYSFNNAYQGIIRFSGAMPYGFKLDKLGDWSVQWGSGSLNADGKNYTGTLAANGGNLGGGGVPAVACYVVNADLGALTITLTKTDDWGLIGDATPGGWSTSSPMNYDGANKIWTITVDLTAGSFKFRANDAWDLNYGSIANDGTLQAGKDNIPIASAGNYTITFDPARLTYTVTKN